MQINQHQGLLTYCSNIHPGESWSKTFTNIRDYTLQVRDGLGVQQFGIGLRLSHQASLELTEGSNLLDFRNWLLENNLYVFTINGFPYGNFHNGPVKDDVHLPDWTTSERLSYTIRLFNILNELLPDGLDGGVSTSPISYKFWHHGAEAISNVKNAAALNIADLVIHLGDLENTSGKRLHLDMEPEPDGLLETASEFVAFFNDYLLTTGLNHIVKTLGCSRAIAEQLIRNHFQICYDVCHFAVGFEKPSEALELIRKEGISIGRVQISAAVSTGNINSEEQCKIAINELRAFDEPTYLHQAVMKNNSGKLERYADLRPALESMQMKNQFELRTHFHVPIFTKKYKTLFSTQSDIEEVLELWKLQNFTNHLEIETYTWDVLPADLQTDIVSSIIRELQWVLNKISA